MRWELGTVNMQSMRLGCVEPAQYAITHPATHPPTHPFIHPPAVSRRNSARAAACAAVTSRPAAPSPSLSYPATAGKGAGSSGLLTSLNPVSRRLRPEVAPAAAPSTAAAAPAAAAVGVDTAGLTMVAPATPTYASRVPRSKVPMGAPSSLLLLAAPGAGSAADAT